MPAPDSHILLIQVSGQDRLGLTHALTQVLSKHQVRVLDIGQALIHDSVALGMLVEGCNSTCELLRTELAAAASLWDVRLTATPVATNEYQRWVGNQVKHRYLVTLLGRTVSAAEIAAVSEIITRHGWNIDRIERLSSRMMLDCESPRTCIEFGVSGPWNMEQGTSDEEGLRAELMRLTSRFDSDVAFQHDNVFRRIRRLVAFDMDSTLIQAEVIDQLARIAGVGDEVAKITESAMRGELDFQQSFRKRVGLLAGLPAAALDRVITDVPLTDGAERLVSTLRRLGYKTAILSGGFTFFGRHLQAKLGIDYLHANELEIVDGKVTGRVVSEIVDGQAKARHLRAIAEREGISLEQTIAVGDGANDLPMLNIAGLGVAFRAKPIVRENARHSISALGLDGILYLLGVPDRDVLAELAPPTDGIALPK
jgi:phosphoserine phosphatase